MIRHSVVQQTSRIYPFCITETSYPSNSSSVSFSLIQILICTLPLYSTCMLVRFLHLCLATWFNWGYLSISQKCSFLTWELEVVHHKFRSKMYIAAYLLWLYFSQTSSTWSTLGCQMLWLWWTLFSSICLWLYPLTCWKGLFPVLRQATARLWYRDPVHTILWVL